MKRTFRALLLCLSLLYFNLVAVGQTIKTVGTGGDYATLKAAFDAINARSITGTIQLQIISSINDNNAAKLYGSGQVGVITIPSGQGGTGYVTGDVVTFSTPEDLNGVAATGRVTAASGAITSIEITDPGSGYAAAPTIASTSGAGTGATPSVIIGGDYTSIDIYPTAANVVLSGAVSGLTGIIDLIGADNVTIDGRFERTGTTTSLTIQNSHAGFTGAFAFKASNDANSNTIRYTRLLSDRSARVELTSSTNGKGVSNFLIENSFISVHANSTIATTQTGISIAGNSSNKNITIKNNEFVDLLAKGSEMLFVNNNPDMLTIEGNHFYSTKTNLTLGDNSKFTIRVNSGTNVTIRGNYIGGSAKQLGGTAFKYTSTGTTIASFSGIYVLSGTSIVIENNAIGNLDLNIQNGTLEAIQCSSTNAIIKNNRIGDLNSSNSIITNTGFRGILVPVGPNLTVEQNSIGGIEAIGFATAVSCTSNGGGNVLNNIIGKIKLKFNGVSQGLVAIATGSNYNIKGNYIYGCTNENPGFTYGISTNSGNSVINNIIHLQASNTSTVSGVEKSGTGSLTVYNNTVLIDGTSNTGNNNSYSLIENGTGAGDYRNNLLINTAANTGDATGKHYAASLLSAPTTINYNNYYVSGTGGVLGSFNNVDKTTLSAWQASTLQDCFSTSINPNFPTPSGVATANFLPTNLNLVATPIAGITTDYLGTSRDASNPSMGALEYTVTPPTPTTTTASTCGSYTWSVNNQSYTESGTYTYTSGCITYTLNLTITTTPSWYVDGDGDSYVGAAITQCDRPTNGYLESELAGANLQLGDCDDSDATKFTSFNFYVDSDGDGFGTGTAVSVCAANANTAPAGYSTNSTDCDDTDATKNASFNFYVDSDGDGFGTGSAVSVCAANANTAPAGYSTNNTDCDDTNATKNASFNFYVDSDGDGFGTGTAVSICAADANTAPAGYSTNSTDCDDTDATKNASFNFYVDSDGDGFGTGTAVSVCAADANTAPAGYSTNSTDCDDTDATKNASFNFYVDSDGDGFGTGAAVSVCAANANAAPAGYSTNSTDCDDTDATKNASFNFYVDSDGDGFGTGTAVSVCAANANTAPTGYSTSNTDCNDNNANINPGKTEVCGNNIDDNCNGQVDEGCAVPCNFKTLTQSGWDATGSSNPLTNSWFAAKFPGGLIIGGTGNCGRFIKLTSAAAVRAMLPSSGVANILSQSWTNPSNKSVKNSLAGELVALTLNIALNPELGNAKIKSGPYMNKTINWLLAEANLKISSTTSKSTELKTLSDACSKVNSSFGKTKSGYVDCDVYNPSNITTGKNDFSSKALFEIVNGDGKQKLKVYPNPSNNYFNIRNTYAHPIQVRIITLNGKIIEEVKSIQPGITYHFGQNLIPGIYVVEVIVNGNSSIQKIIKVG